MPLLPLIIMSTIDWALLIETEPKISAMNNLRRLKWKSRGILPLCNELHNLLRVYVDSYCTYSLLLMMLLRVPHYVHSWF